MRVVRPLPILLLNECLIRAPSAEEEPLQHVGLLRDPLLVVNDDLPVPNRVGRPAPRRQPNHTPFLQLTLPSPAQHRA